MTEFLTLHDPARARAYYDAGVWRDETFYSLLAGNAAVRGDRFALRSGDRRLTWVALKDWVDAVAGVLQARGLGPGDRVSVWLSNRLETVAILLACARDGYVVNPSLHGGQSPQDIAQLMDKIGTKLLITEHDVDGGGRQILRLDAAGALPEPGDAPPGGLIAPNNDPDRVFYIAFTSGTTGLPKGVMHSANTILANTRDMVADWGHGPDTVILSLSPLSHHIAWVALGQALSAGAELVINAPPAGVGALDWILDTGATYVMGVPTHAIDILSAQAARGLDRLGSVRVFYMAGAPIPRATAEAFIAQGITPQNVYGMSENSSHQYTHPDDGTDVIVGSCGRGGPGYEVRIFDPENRDRELPAGAAGEIGGRGGALMLGYFNDQAATEASFNRAGWFMSGDLGRLDGAGNLQIVGRLKDVIIRGGHNIYPAQIENLAVRHPAIDKAAVFAVADERLGEKACLAILPAGAPPDAPGALAHLHAAGLAKRDMPEYFVVLDSFPLTASGKILKRALAEQARVGEIAPQPCRFTTPEA